MAALAACAVLDTGREAAFDSIVFTVAQLFRAPMAMLTLIDSSRVWAKATVGPLVREWARHEVFCNAFVVDDLDGVLAKAAAEGVAAIGREDGDENGRFAWLLDDDGRKIELWEPKPED